MLRGKAREKILSSFNYITIKFSPLEMYENIFKEQKPSIMVKLKDFGLILFSHSKLVNFHFKFLPFANTTFSFIIVIQIAKFIKFQLIS